MKHATNNSTEWLALLPVLRCLQQRLSFQLPLRKSQLSARLGVHQNSHRPKSEIALTLPPAQPHLSPIFQLVWLRLCLLLLSHRRARTTRRCRMSPSSCEHDRAAASVRLFTRLRCARKSAEWEVCTKASCIALTSYKIG